jgi:hypothetical protein
MEKEGTGGEGKGDAVRERSWLGGGEGRWRWEVRDGRGWPAGEGSGCRGLLGREIGDERRMRGEEGKGGMIKII